MHIIGNCLLVDTFNKSDFKEGEWERITDCLGSSSSNVIHTADHLDYIIEHIGIQNAAELIHQETNQKIELQKDPIFQRYVISSHYASPEVLCIAIYKIYRNIKKCLKTINYLEMMGYELPMSVKQVVGQVVEQK